ncbi:CynX/NimT family MFS transporter [Streptomyces sp. NBC_00096]|uniref:CynX/NimT family MFS transporter n=1 Tax=Streptomyces sp. NBC_00096 TaxID=2975650 RepID=UPI00324B8EF2
MASSLSLSLSRSLSRSLSLRKVRAVRVWALFGVVVLAVNLRAAITGVAPVLAELKAQFGLSGFGTSVLTTLPVLCLGVFASLAPPLARRVGAEVAVAGALVLITTGILIRLLDSPVALFSGTVLAGAGIAAGNVLLPAIIKCQFPGRVGSVTGLAMMLMAGSGAFAAGLAVPLDHAAGWRVAFAVWAVPSAIAATVWAVRGRVDCRCVPATTPQAPGAAAGSLLRSPLAWSVAAFLGLVSLVFYVLVSWLPAIMRDGGYPATEAGVMVSVMLLIGIPLGFAVPLLATRLGDQRPLVLVAAGLTAAGLAGLLLAPGAGWVWVCVLGLATGSAFPLAVTLLSLRSPSPVVAAGLSGMAQTVGYLLAGLGPLAVGALRGATGGWHVPLLVVLGLVVPETYFGLRTARPGFVRPLPAEGAGDGDGGGGRDGGGAAGPRIPAPRTERPLATTGPSSPRPASG